MIPLVVAACCGLLVYHFQRFSIGASRLVPLCILPLAFAGAFGFLGMMFGVIYSGTMVRLDLR